MAIPFPVIRTAIRRTITPGGYPVRQFVAMNGATTTIARGSKPFDARLVLEFPYINDTDVALIWQTWYATLGGGLDVELPANAFSGVDSALVAQIPPELTWYMEEPQIRSVRPLLSDARISFVGRLTSGSLFSVPPPEGSLFGFEHISQSAMLGTIGVAADGTTHGVEDLGNAGLLGYWGYNPLTPATATTLYRRRFTEAGWGVYRPATNQLRPAFTASPSGDLVLFFFAFDGDGSTISTITKQRLYKVTVDPSTGAVTAAAAWDRVLQGSTENQGTNPWKTTGGANVNGAVIDTNGDMYIAHGVARMNLGVTSDLGTGYPTVTKILANGTQAWAKRIDGPFTPEIALHGDSVYLVLSIPTSDGNAYLKLSKADGSTQAGPYRYQYTPPSLSALPVGGGNFAVDQNGDLYVTPGLSGDNYVRNEQVMKISANMTAIQWSKQIPVRSDMSTFWGKSQARALSWDSTNNRLLLTGDYVPTDPGGGSANRRVVTCAIDASGAVIKSWGMINKGYTASPSYESIKSALYGGNLIIVGGLTLTLSYPTSLSANGIVSFDSGMTPLELGEINAGTPADTTNAVLSGHPGVTSIFTDPGNAFIQQATSLSSTSESAGTMSQRFLYS